jgi:hypothetical protein
MATNNTHRLVLIHRLKNWEWPGNEDTHTHTRNLKSDWMRQDFVAEQTAMPWFSPDPSFPRIEGVAWETIKHTQTHIQHTGYIFNVKRYNV